MHTLRKICRFPSHILNQRLYYKIYNNAFGKPMLYVHTSCQQLEEQSNSQKSSVLVYQAPLKARIKFAKYLSLSSSMLGFAVFPVVINNLCQTHVFLGLAAGTISAFFLSTPLMLHWITKRYVLELHYDTYSEVFTAKTFNIVNQIKEIKFKATDVTVPDLPGMLSSFLVDGKPLFVDANMIQDPDAYSHMMGYDKPLDFSIEDEQSENPKAS